MSLDYISLQNRNPLGICAFFPIDSRKIELIKVKKQLLFKKREKTLDIHHFFETSCPQCISMFMTLKYIQFIPHFHQRHQEIKIVENIDIFIEYYEKAINMMFSSNKLDLEGFFLEIPTYQAALSFLQKNEEIIENNILKPVELLTHISSVKNGINDMVKNLIISPHPKDPKFSKGMFFKFCIDIRNEDGYVRAYSIRENAQNLTEKEGLIDMWQKNQKVQETISEYSEILNLPYEKLIMNVKNVCNGLRGIYLHPKLIVEYASWISVKFRVYTQDIIMNFFGKEAENKLNNEILRLRIENGEKTSKIDVLINDVNDLKTEVKSLKIEVVKTRSTVEDAFKFIDDRLNRMTVEVKPNYKHVFAIFEPITDDLKKKIEFYNTYIVIRCQSGERDKMKIEKEIKFGVKLEPIFEISHANPIELVNKISELRSLERKHSKIVVHNSEKEFIFEIKKIIISDAYEYMIIKDKYQNQNF